MQDEYYNDFYEDFEFYYGTGASPISEASRVNRRQMTQTQSQQDPKGDRGEKISASKTEASRDKADGKQSEK